MLQQNDRGLSDEQRMMRDACRAFVDAHVISEPPEPTWTSRSRAGRPSSIPTGTWVAGYDWDYDVIQDEHQDRPGRWHPP